MSRSKRNPGVIPGLGVLITFEQVYFQAARPQDLVNYVERFPLIGFLSMICGIAAILHNSTAPTPFAFQIDFAREFANEVLRAKRIVEILQDNPDAVLVHDEQLAVLVKFGVLHASAEQWPEEAADTLIRTLLVYNSLHGKEHDPQPGKRSRSCTLSCRTYSIWMNIWVA